MSALFLYLTFSTKISSFKYLLSMPEYSFLYEYNNPLISVSDNSPAAGTLTSVSRQ